MQRILLGKRRVWIGLACVLTAGVGVALCTNRDSRAGADFRGSLDRLVSLAEECYRGDRELSTVAGEAGGALAKRLSEDWLAWYELRAYVESAPPGTPESLVAELLRLVVQDEEVAEGLGMWGYENWYWKLLVRSLVSRAPLVFADGRRWTVGELSAWVLMGCDRPWLEGFLGERGIAGQTLRQRGGSQLAGDLRRYYWRGGAVRGPGRSGTPSVVKEFWGKGSAVELESLMAVGSRVFFVKYEAGDPDRRSELWVSDGTYEGTELVQGPTAVRGLQGRVSSLVAADGRLVFLREYGGEKNRGEEVWITDGTAQSTLLLVGRAEGRGFSQNARIEKFGSRVAFLRTLVDERDHRAEVWVTDGTRGGTKLVLELAGGQFLGPVLGVLEDRMLFETWDEARKTCLWVSDGTKAGTSVLLSDGGQKEPGLFVAAAGNRLYFAWQDAASGVELWVTDGTKAGTRLVLDIVPGPGSSAPLAAMALEGRLLFVPAYPDSPKGVELWVSDGDAHGTFLLAELLARQALDGPVTLGDCSFERVGGRALVVAQGKEATRLWATDGTREGTGLIAELRQCVLLQPVGVGAFFVGGDAHHGQELWWTDGTRDKTALVRDIRPGPQGSMPGDFCAAGGRMFFVASDGRCGFELWVSDGTPEGTRLVKDIVPGIRGSNPDIKLAVNDRVFFVADDPQYGRELWVSDGTEGGTSLVLDIVPGTLGSDPAGMVRAGDCLFFVARVPYGAPIAWLCALGLSGP